MSNTITPWISITHEEQQSFFLINTYREKCTRNSNLLSFSISLRMWLCDVSTIILNTFGCFNKNFYSMTFLSFFTQIYYLMSKILNNIDLSWVKLFAWFMAEFKEICSYLKIFFCSPLNVYVCYGKMKTHIDIMAKSGTKVSHGSSDYVHPVQQGYITQIENIRCVWNLPLVYSST